VSTDSGQFVSNANLGKMTRDQRFTWASTLLSETDEPLPGGRLDVHGVARLEATAGNLVRVGVSDQRLASAAMSMYFMLIDSALRESRPEIAHGISSDVWLRHRNRLMVRHMKRTSDPKTHALWDQQRHYYVPMFWSWRYGDTWQVKWAPTWHHGVAPVALRSMRASLLHPVEQHPAYDRIPRRILRPTGFINEWVKESRAGEDPDGLW
jgi:hypothetical protein